MACKDQRDSGTILVSVLFLCFLLVALGAGIGAYVHSEVATSAALTRGIQAQYLAEAGIQDGIVKLASDRAFTGSYSRNLGSEGIYKVSILARQPWRRLVVSQAICQGEARELVMEIDLSLTLPRCLLATEGDLLLGAQDYLQGVISAGGAIQGTQGVFVDGPWLGQKIEADGSVIVGGCHPAAGLLVPAAAVAGHREDPLLPPDQFVNGDFYYSGTLALVQPAAGLGARGTVYVDGDVYVPAYYHVRGPWLLAASGSIIVGHDANLEQVWLWAGQNLTVGARVQLVGGAWSKGCLQIGEQAHFYGAAPPLVSELPVVSADVFLIRSWNTYELKEGL
nr:hypothetical protein [uncultured Anaeromusa sp.]